MLGNFGGHIRRDSILYKKFIDAYGDMVVDEIIIDKTDDDYVRMNIKIDFADED